MKYEFRTTGSMSLTENFASTAQRVLSIDVAKYDEYMRNSGMSFEQKEDFLRGMLSIVMTFVELGFGIHPLQQLDEREPCGKDESCENQRPKDAINGVTSKATPKLEPKNRTGPDGRLEV